MCYLKTVTQFANQLFILLFIAGSYSYIRSLLLGRISRHSIGVSDQIYDQQDYLKILSLKQELRKIINPGKDWHITVFSSHCTLSCSQKFSADLKPEDYSEESFLKERTMDGKLFSIINPFPCNSDPFHWISRFAEGK